MAQERTGDKLTALLKERPPTIIPTWFPSIDNATHGGLRTGDISLICAFEGAGKTALAEQFALAIAETTDVGFLPIEIRERQCLSRMGAKIAKCSETDFVRIGVDPLVRGTLNSLKLHVMAPDREKGAWTYAEIEALIREKRYPYWVVDHVREIDDWLSEAYAAPAKMVKKFKRLAEELDVHISLCSQIKSECLGRPPHLWVPLDAPQLLYSSSLSLMLQRPFARHGALHDTVMHVVVRKNRYGPQCLIHYRWVPTTMSMYEMTEEDILELSCCKRSKGVKADASR